MRFEKLKLSIFLILALVLSTIRPFFAFAADTANYSGAISRMKQLGAFDSSMRDMQIITREEFTKAVVVASNLIDTANAMEGSTIFPDVPANSALSGYVNILLDKNLITGMADGKFHPEYGLTYSEICTVLVKMLGYTDGDLTGPWPSNYFSKASKLKLTNNLKFNRNDKITLRDAAVMFDRLLNTEIKNDSANSTSKTIFSDSTNLYSEGIIYDNGDTSSNLGDNEVLTDKGILYMKDNTTNLEVGATYRLKVEEGEIIKAYGKSKDTVNITVNNVIGNVVYYKENDKEENMTLPSSISYYYHGVKQDYENLTNLLQTNMSIIFTCSNSTSYSYAVIADPKYSKPEVASNFNPLYNKLGDITFDSKTKIVKNGEIITRKDIKDMDVVYNVTDINANNRYILVQENKAEGNIKAFLGDGNSPTGIEIDTGSYNYDKNMKFSKLSSFSTGDLVALILTYDGKVIDIKTIKQKTGSLIECIVLGDYRSSDGLADNEVLTDKGTFTYASAVNSLEVGVKYQLYLSDNVITKIYKKINSAINYAVIERTGSGIKVENDKEEAVSMKLPKALTYYYHGEKISYNSAVSSIDDFSSIILSGSSSSKTYDYAIIIDPYYSEPKVFQYADTELWNEIQSSDYSYIYRNEMYTENPYSISNNDVIYFVSDIWNKNNYIYASNKVAYGYIQAFSPSKRDANSIKINNETYEFSQYFDKTKLKSYYTGSFIRLHIGVDGKIVSIE